MAADDDTNDGRTSLIERISGREFDDEFELKFLRFISGQVLSILHGEHNTKRSRYLHARLHRYWEHTGQREQILRAYSPAQIEAAITDAWLMKWDLFGVDWARDVHRVGLLNKNIADQAERARSQGDKVYSAIRSIYAQLIQENPELAKRASGKARNSLIGRRLGKASSPALIKQIQRALRGMK
jgi:hypothetical protein